MFYIYLVIDSLYTLIVINQEHRFVTNLAEGIQPEFIISDGRYGSYVKGIPSFIISHQISFVMPRGFGIFQRLGDYVNYKTFKRFNAVLVPDYGDTAHNLAGKMSHHPMLQKLEHYYVGILSSLKKEDVEEDIHMLFSTGGFLSPHKPSFVDSLIEQAKIIPGKKIFILGKVGGDDNRSLGEYDIEILSSVAGHERQTIFNRAKMVVSRSGYTTIMDLVELEKPGVLIPTPGQTEQEYLAEYLADNENFLVSPHETVGETYTGKTLYAPFLPPWKTARSVEIVREIIGTHTDNF